MAGLLENQPSGGLLDFFTSPAGQGLLSAVGAGLAGARRGAPLNAIGAGMLGGLQGYAGAQDQQAQMKRMDQQTKLFDMTMQQHQAAQDAAKRAQDAASARQGYLGSIGRVTSPVIGAQPNQFDPMKWMQLGGSVDDAQRLASSKDWGASEVARTIEGTDPQGNKVTYQYDKFGRPVGQGVQAYTAPVQVDLGGRVQFVKPTAGVTLTKGMTPGEAASNEIARKRLEFEQGGGLDGGGVAQIGLVKQYGKPPAGYRWKPDGSMEFIPGGPADQKAQLQKTGEGTVASVVADLRDKYRQLDKDNAVVSQGNQWGTNIGAWLGNTGVGQTLGGMVGTSAQNARDAIAMTRPLLLQSIMKATGMSAKQMDSNAELKMYLATATDPKFGLQANMEALDRIEQLYGGGAPAKPAAPSAPTQGNQVKTVVRTGMLNGRKVIQYSDGTTAYGD